MTYIPTRTEVLAQINTLITELKQFAKSEFDIDVSSLSPEVKFRDTKRLGIAGINKFGKPVMRLNVFQLVTYPVLMYSEYRSLAGIPSIGSFRTNDWKTWVDALVLHEFAHVIQFNIKYQPTRLRISGNKYDRLGEYESGHGTFFQRIYSILRRRYLNDRVQHEAIVGHAFDAPVERETRPTIVTNNPYLGRVVVLNGKRYTVVEIHPRNRKYPLIVANGNSRYKISINQLTANAA